jgi:hypothetical protein
MEMPRAFITATLLLLTVLIFSSVAVAQTPQSQPKQTLSPWKYYPKDVAVGDGGPAPKRDLSGTWAGPGSSPAIPAGTPAEKPSLTPLAQQIMSQRKSVGRYGPAGANDPTATYCDPLGFPRNYVYQNRAMSVAKMSDRVVFMLQFGGFWREVWTDGRPLPVDFGNTRDSFDPTFMGYSVGHWEDDYNFVIDTTGLDERTWVMNDGTPHSVNAHVQERWTRIDHNTMKVSMTIDDPKMYTKPFSLGTYFFRWVPNQKINEWLCVPSETLKYLTEQGNPAGPFPDEPTERRGGGRRRGQQ